MLQAAKIVCLPDILLSPQRESASTIKGTLHEFPSTESDQENSTHSDTPNKVYKYKYTIMKTTHDLTIFFFKKKNPKNKILFTTYLEVVILLLRAKNHWKIIFFCPIQRKNSSCNLLGKMIINCKFNSLPL